MITLYGIRNCDACRKALKWLQNNDIGHSYIDIRESEMNADLLDKWLTSVSRDELLNRRSTTWRQIPPGERNKLTNKSARNLILRYPTVMKRPVLDFGDQVILGFDASIYSDLNLSQ
jgi:Spx/MgsR family transcriptional regulator